MTTILMYHMADADGVGRLDGLDAEIRTIPRPNDIQGGKYIEKRKPIKQNHVIGV
jgi:hypothetical protein